MKLKEILILEKILKEIINNTNIKIDALLKFKLLGILRTIEVPILNFETIRTEVIREFGSVSENDGIIIEPNTDAYEKFIATLSPLLESEVDINVTKLKASEIFDKGIDANYLMVLYPIIEE